MPCRRGRQLQPEMRGALKLRLNRIHGLTSNKINRPGLPKPFLKALPNPVQHPDPILKADRRIDPNLANQTTRLPQTIPVQNARKLPDQLE